MNPQKILARLILETMESRDMSREGREDVIRAGLMAQTGLSAQPDGFWERHEETLGGARNLEQFVYRLLHAVREEPPCLN